MNFDHEQGSINTILTIDTTESPALGGQTNTLIITGSGSVALPIGNTAARPGTPTAGMIRFNNNSSPGTLEYYDNSPGWQTLAISGGGGGVSSITGTANQITASASTGAVTLSLPTAVSTGSYIATETITGSLSAGAFSYGTLSYSDVNIFGSFTMSVNNYAQFVHQNTNSGTTASTDIVMNNNLGTSTTYYGNFGINSSGFTGSGSLNTPNMVYLTSTTGDLSIGTTTSNAIHFVINDGASDAMTITNTGVISILGTTTSTSTTSGVLTVAGGLGVAGAINTGTINGFSMGLGGGSISTNMAFGNNALTSNTTGTNNLAISNAATLGALTFNTTGDDNFAIGNQTLTFNTTGSQNLAIGHYSGTGITTQVATFGTITGGSGYTNGTYTNVTLTYLSGTTNANLIGPTVNVTVSGGAVTALVITNGGACMTDTTTVFTVANTSIGSTGSGFSVGISTLAIPTGNVALGYFTLSGSVTRGWTSASENTAIGYAALSQITTGQGNTGIGYGALEDIGSGGGNTGIGLSAGISGSYGLQGASAQNTMLGADTGSNISDPTNSTAIGYGAIVTASNQMVLGNASLTTITTVASITGTQFISTVSTGTAPLTVASTTNVANLNASLLNGYSFGATGPGGTGYNTPSTGAFAPTTVTWTTETLPSSAAWGSIASNGGSVLVTIVAGSGSSSNVTAYSTNGGVSWTAGGNLPATQQWAKVAYGGGTWVAVGSATGGTAGTAAAYSTNNGVSWTAITMASAIWTSVTYANSQWVAIASGGTIAAYSTNGTSWTAATLPSSSTWTDVAGGYIGATNYFVAISSGGTAGAYSTNGGSTWTATGALPSSNTWTSIAYGNGYFVAIVGGGTSSAAAALTGTGTTWVSETLSATAKWSQVSFGNNIFLVIAGNTTASTVTSYSTLGSLWTAGTALPSSSNWSAACSNGIGGFAAIVTGSTSAGIMSGSPLGLAVASGAISLGNGSIQTAGTITCTNSTASSEFTTGAVIISGGIGVGGLSYFNSGLNISGGSFSCSGVIQPAAGTATLAPIKFQSGTNLTTATAGVLEYDGNCYYATTNATTPLRGAIATTQAVVLNATYTLTSQTAAQKLFNATTNGTLTLPVGTYRFECVFNLTSMSTSSGTFGFSLGGTFVGTQAWQANAVVGAAATAASSQTTFNTAANTALATAGTAGVGTCSISGIIRVTTAGTVIPEVSLSVAAAAIVSTNSFFNIYPLGNGTVTTVGNWS